MEMKFFLVLFPLREEKGIERNIIVISARDEKEEEEEYQQK